MFQKKTGRNSNKNSRSSKTRVSLSLLGEAVLSFKEINMVKNEDREQFRLMNCGDPLGLSKPKKGSKMRKAGSPSRSDAKVSGEFFDNRIHKFLSTKEASGLLGVSPNALRILVCRKKVRAYKLGNRLKFRHSDLADCLQQKEV